MAASSKFVGAASALAISAALVSSGTIVTTVAGVTAAHAATVSRIEVRGNTRVDAQTVRDNVGITPGKPFSNADIDAATKRLFGTGLFSDVRISQAGGALIVQVSENQVVNQVIFQGNKKIKDPQLQNAVQLKPRAAFDQTTLEADTEAVRAAYRNVGRSDATVNSRIMDLGEGRVNVVFEINEGDRTKISNITFVGNQAFGSRRLRDVISTKKSNPLSWLTRNDVYSEDRLRADEESLRRFYYNRGYADFRVVSSTAELDPATNEYTITITVEEGDKYAFGGVNIESSVEGVDTAQLQGLVETREGDTYSAKEIEDSILKVSEKVAGQGYAFAKVEPRGDRNFENRTISVTYAIDQGPRAYVERIEIRGNEKTRDFVIRREFDVSEGDAFNQVLIQRAKRRLERLEFFQTVNISTAPGSQPDQVVLVVDVVEKATGEFSIGGGYTTGGENPGPTVEASITERNFLGRGQFVRIGAGGGLDNNRTYSLSFTEPYFLGQRISAGFDIYKRQSGVRDKYETDVTGATIRFGLPITEELTAGLAYNITREEYEIDEDALNDDGTPDLDEISRAFADAAEDSPWVKSSVSWSLTYNSIDDVKNPRDGIYAKFYQEYAGIGGDANFLKTTFTGSYYKTLMDELDVVGLVRIGGGHIQGFGDDLRVFDTFKNTTDMIRGFKYNGIGPRDASVRDDKGSFLGGNTYFNATVETQFPMPVIPESIGIRGALFADAATLFGSDLDDAKNNGDDTTKMEWRASVGASIMWASPFGPLRFDYAVPVKKVDGDQEQNFNFGMSSKF
ncbi:outer membrane protein assembly factor BamA [Phyllobacterium sp. 21LDTY02-6]|uniref:outer membrane protein assembly factor BamA n=1 Tax=unclassified Phyllobacterium TaxID=2638441 RepID=UPI002022945A|nr:MULTISPECIES: outer membrane protein assembly factor BamA [unclassified Phyllobacterium]MCO4316508.1 outer membrane protein assembly factor BamA [Phyllobacterium sp. 21LDTY02-6]MCX8280690.1 outer membrane protein assembly factor BamA [Phyllobacterium sp. 0TCS1.6C]MCX8292733.1 outer membrane protein assembly factor BamA [Phyllobacterium sp. 0TCS1.6A]